jgi:uncharacterized protein YuzB (UPF0349 family)
MINTEELYKNVYTDACKIALVEGEVVKEEAEEEGAKKIIQ